MYTEYVRSSRFRRAYKKLPNNIQNKVGDALLKFEENPKSPGLNREKIRSVAGVFAIRVDKNYRITFHEKDDKCYLRNVGQHNIIDKSA